MARYRPTVADAIAFFEHDADEALVVKTRQLVASGEAEWIEDPEVDRTFGLVKPGTNRALVVVYAPKPDMIGHERWDFEVGEELW